MLNRAYHERDREVGQALKMKGKGALGDPTRKRPRPVDLVLQTGTRLNSAQFGGPNGGGISFKTGKEFGWRTGGPGQRGMHGMDDSDGDRWG